MENLSVEYGISTVSWRTMMAFRILVSMSEIGSVATFSSYQLDLITPGSSPLKASPRKQILHISNLPMNARGLPQIVHLFLARTLNFGVRFAFSIIPFLAMAPPLTPERHAHELQELKGLFVRLCGRGNGDVHPPHPIDLVILYLRKNDLLLQSHSVIAPPVERLRR